MAFNERQIFARLNKANLMEDGKPVSFSKFKGYATIYRYSANKHKIVFVGQPKENLFGFYVKNDSDMKVLREAYDWFVRMAKGDLAPLNEKDVQIGNCGLPKGYVSLKYK